MSISEIVPRISELTFANAAEACSDIFLFATFKILSSKQRMAEMRHSLQFLSKLNNTLPSATQQFHWTFADVDAEEEMRALLILDGQRDEATNPKDPEHTMEIFPTALAALTLTRSLSVRDELSRILEQRDKQKLNEKFEMTEISARVLSPIEANKPECLSKKFASAHAA